MSDLAPGTVLAGYRIEGLLGRGGMGTVYRATQFALRREVALKLIGAPLSSDPTFRERFRREALAAAAVDHPHVLPVYEAGECDGVPFIAMRLVEGESLRDMLRRQGALDPGRVVVLAAQVALALEAAHAHGVVHRDVKPANVLITQTGDGEHAYLADFGVAMLQDSETFAVTGEATGTLGYIAPEALRGEPVDGRADIYGLGCVVYEILTGEVPFPRPTRAAVMAAHLFDPPPSARDHAPAVPPELDAVVRWALAKSPDARPQRATELASALRGAAGGRGTVGIVSSAPERTNLPARRPELIGRDTELRDLVTTCRAAESRLITVTGPAGVGKTELALEAAQRLVGAYADGIFWVELESSAASDVPAAIARVLSLADAPGVTPLERVIEHGRGRRLLILLDNFEHVLDAAADVVRIVEGAPPVQLLVTSQAPLRARGERCVELRSLGIPATSLASPDLLREVPAVALLVKRARSVAPDFELTPANAEATAELCRRLDGLPLALELAAARLRVLEPAELLMRLGTSLDVLGRGRRDLPMRHRGLRAALDWTTRQLTATDRALLGQLGVFSGGFTVDLAEAAADGDVLDRLEALRDISLLRRAADGRLSMAPPVRAYALELLRAMGGEDAACGRHADAILDLIGRQSWVRNLEEGLRTVRAEEDNLRQALRWLRDARPESHARLVARAGQLLSQAGREQQIAPEIELALERAPDPSLRARLLVQRAFALEGLGEVDLFRAAVAACREAGEELALVEALCGLANVHAALGEGEPALAVARESQALAERLGDQAYLAMAAQMVGQALRVCGRATEALATLRAVTDRASAGSFAAISGATYLADAALDAGDAAEALSRYGQALRVYEQLGTPPNMALQLDGSAVALAALGRHEEALATTAVSDRLRREFSCRVAPEWRRKRDAALTPSREAVGPDAERLTVARADAMQLRQAIDWVAALSSGDLTTA